MKLKISFTMAMLCALLFANNAKAQSWNITGNAGTNSTNNFIGPTDNVSFKVRTNNAVRVTVTNKGMVGIGNASPVYKLDVKGGSINTDSVYRIGGGIALSVLGSDNTFVGIGTGTSNTGFGNVGVGKNALLSNTSGVNNTATGLSALKSNTTGLANTATGTYSLFTNGSGSNNAAFGNSSLTNNSSGYSNTALGTNAGYSNTNGYKNTFVGDSAGYANSTGNSNTYVGYNAKGTSALTNASAMGTNASVTTSNAMVLGSITGVNGATSNCNVGIGTTSPTHARLEINGAVGSAVAMFGADKCGITLGADNPEVGFNYFYNGTNAKTIKTGYASVLGMDQGNGSLYIGNFNGNQSSSNFGNISGYRNIMTIKQNGSIAGGYLSTASGTNSAMAFGYSNTASGSTATAFGSNTIAGGDNSFTAGLLSHAVGNNSGAVGNNCVSNGTNAFATGDNTSANGSSSFTSGFQTAALGNNSVAFGNTTTASGTNCVTMGNNCSAAGNGSLAMGSDVYVNGTNAFAIGTNIALNPNGPTANNSLVLGGNSAFGTSMYMDNLFRARFNRYLFETDADGATGVSLVPGAGSWSGFSSRKKKRNFTDVNEEDVLQKICTLPLTEWSYIHQADNWRHIGPMAQDFWAAFHLDGESDTTINTLDIDGVNMAGIQALKIRTDDLKTENESLKSTVNVQQKQIDELKNIVRDMQQSLSVCCLNYETGKNSQQPAVGSQQEDVARLEQNNPNPFSQNTVIHFYIPSSAKSAVIKITDANSKELKSFTIAERGASQISISANTLAAGAYTYQLIVDGKMIDAKRMTLTK